MPHAWQSLVWKGINHPNPLSAQGERGGKTQKYHTTQFIPGWTKSDRNASSLSPQPQGLTWAREGSPTVDHLQKVTIPRLWLILALDSEPRSTCQCASMRMCVWVCDAITKVHALHAHMRCTLTCVARSHERVYDAITKMHALHAHMVSIPDFSRETPDFSQNPKP